MPLVKVECCRALTNLMCEETDDNMYEQKGREGWSTLQSDESRARVPGSTRPKFAVLVEFDEC